MIRWLEKDPTDSIVVEFDFKDDATSVSGPTVAVQASDATLDPNPNAIKAGAPTVIGTRVLQRIVNGVNGVDYFFQCVGTTNTGDVLTIEAVLPVRTRPVVVKFTPVYMTPDEFAGRFSQAELTDLQTEGVEYGRAENEAASLVNGYLATRYALPLASVPGIVKGWCADITRYKLWDERAPTEVKERYEAALKQLEQLAKGLIALPPDAAGVPAEAGIEFGGYSWERVFTEDSLANY